MSSVYGSTALHRGWVEEVEREVCLRCPYDECKHPTYCKLIKDAMADHRAKEKAAKAEEKAQRAIAKQKAEEEIKKARRRWKNSKRLRKQYAELKSDPERYRKKQEYTKAYQSTPEAKAKRSEYMRKRLEDLKKDPERYKAYLYHRALLARIRIAKMTPEQREAMRAKKRKSYEKMMNDPERHENKVQKQRERRQRDKDYCRVYEREYYKRNADKIKEKARRSYNRRLQDPETREKMKAAQARYYETRKAKLEADPIAREHAKYLRRMYQRQHYQRMKLEQPEKYEALRQKNKEKYQRRKAANDTKESKGA